jgi:hypothetical protein
MATATEDAIVANLVERVAALLEKYPVENMKAAKLNQDEISQHEIREETESTLVALAKTKLELVLDKLVARLEKVSSQREQHIIIIQCITRTRIMSLIA